MKANKKGQAITLAGLSAIVVLLVVGIFIATFSADIVDDVQEGFRAGDSGTGCTVNEANCTGAAFNVSENGLRSFLNLTGQFGNIGTVIGAGLIIGILVTAFAFVGAKGVQVR